MYESPETTPRRRVGRPSKRILSMRLIVDRALEIVTNEGLDSLTMSRLAGALEVTPAALYNHVSSKEEILREVQDRITAPIPLGELEEDAAAWERGVDELARTDEDVAEYVRRLERAQDAAELPEASGDAIAKEFEQFLRRRRETD